MTVCLVSLETVEPDSVEQNPKIVISDKKCSISKIPKKLVLYRTSVRNEKTSWIGRFSLEAWWAYPHVPTEPPNSLLESGMIELWRNLHFRSHFEYQMGSQKGAQIEYLPISRFCVGEAMRRRFWGDLKFQLRHSSIIQLPNKPLGDPIGTFR